MREPPARIEPSGADGASSGSRRVVLVAGGGRGVGAAAARALATRGDAVAIHCHASLAEARRLADAITAAGGAALAVTANLREEGAVRALVHRVADRFGRIDGLLACARMRRSQPFEAITTADLAAHLEVAVGGTLVMAQEVAAVMAAQATGGAMVFRVEPAAIAAGDLPFTVSQAAVSGLARAIATELRGRQPRIRVGCLVAAAPPAAPDDVARGMLALLDRDDLDGIGVGLDAV
jgi:NAD(P)-dependent dehydrogenase (short-subunit alcohol dehydrogenase family)